MVNLGNCLKEIVITNLARIEWFCKLSMFWKLWCPKCGNFEILNYIKPKVLEI
jgi:hypothetical protein